MTLMVTHVSGKVIHSSTKFFSSHKALDRVHRGVGNLKRRLSPHILQLQTLTFPESARPSVIQVAFFITALSEFAPKYHVGEFQCFWFARAACDGMHAQFKGDLKPGRDVRAMGTWKTAYFKYLNPSKSIAKEYKEEVDQYVKDFADLQSQGRELGIEQGRQKVLQQGRQIGVQEGRQEGIEERKRLEEENAKLRAELAAR
ncbi:hypothetical protein FB451DRAFT_515938 [Mycena latifolia]|nr:hypothetical protein FB451DRAFT_515938 [Mycena latifolia]